MIISKTCSYGIRALAYLSSHNQTGYMSVKDIGRALDLPAAFLSKILFQLASSDIIKSHKGPGGGVTLNKPSETIRLKDIIVAVDGDSLFTECLLRMPDCSSVKPCALHEQWGGLRAEITKKCEQTNLSEISTMLEGQQNQSLF